MRMNLILFDDGGVLKISLFPPQSAGQLHVLVRLGPDGVVVSAQSGPGIHASLIQAQGLRLPGVILGEALQVLMQVGKSFPGVVQLVFQHLDGLFDGVHFGDESFQGQIGAEFDVRTVGAVLQAGLGQLQRVLFGFDGHFHFADRIFLFFNFIPCLQNNRDEVYMYCIYKVVQ